MIRRIIQIDEEKCSGCGACAAACYEGAIGMADGKARLLREDYCDGLGDCLPQCPTGAITFVEREAAGYDAQAVAESRKRMAKGRAVPPHTGCSGQRTRTLARKSAAPAAAASQLGQWPCQLKLSPIRAPYFGGAELLIAADCTAYAYADMHGSFMRGRITLIGCPKLDGVDYSQKLAEILKSNDIRSVTILRMEGPCCGGLELAASKALQQSGKRIPYRVITVSIDGKVIGEP